MMILPADGVTPTELLLERNHDSSLRRSMAAVSGAQGSLSSNCIAGQAGIDCDIPGLLDGQYILMPQVLVL